MEDNDDDLKDEKEPSQKMAKLDELLLEVVIVEEDDKTLPIPDVSQNIEDSQSLKYLNTSIPRPMKISSLPTCSVRTRPWGRVRSGRGWWLWTTPGSRSGSY